MNFKIKTRQNLFKIKNELRDNFEKEKIGEQTAYEENVKMFQPIIDNQIKLIDQPKDHSNIISTDQEEKLAIEYPLLQLGGIAAEKLKEIYKKNYDYAYGIKPIENSTDFELGNKTIKVNNNNIKIDEKEYIGTVGLWELLTMKIPKNFTNEDLKNYQEIIETSKVYLTQDGTVKSNRGYKYMNFIRPIYEKNKTPNKRQTIGYGFKFLSSDPLELFKRLKILILEKDSGNNNVVNEINAIALELYRMKKINEKLFEKLFL